VSAAGGEQAAPGSPPPGRGEKGGREGWKREVEERGGREGWKRGVEEGGGRGRWKRGVEERGGRGRKWTRGGVEVYSLRVTTAMDMDTEV